MNTLKNLLKNPKERAEWIYGQPMAACPKCGSYEMKPQIPIQVDLTGTETTAQMVNKWARATRAGATPLLGIAYYMCWNCGHKGPTVDCTGKTSEEAKRNRALNDEMKRLWNTQNPEGVLA